ncbi:MAG: glycosyltransferase family 2 protein [bacterium]|nr:glycosyltransferase family 2 protein [bacterium]
MKISVIILNKNEEDAIYDCLASVRQLADEIIVLDGGSTDKSLETAKNFKARIIKQTGNNFAAWRTQALLEAKGDWILYLDPDERLTPLLNQEIMEEISKENQVFSAFAIPRRNFLLGKELKNGGWFPDFVKRLFLRENLKKWIGDLHEQPVFEGEMGKFKNAMIHLQPDKIEPAFEKSIGWSKIEAKLIYDSNHPPVSWWRVLRMGLTTLFERLVKKQGLKDGAEGWIESIYQAFHTMIVYLRVWEMQKNE